MELQTFDSPDSSSIARAAYLPDSRELRVTFRRKTLEVTYTYANVPQSLWEEFDAATSKGTFFGKHIRPLYSGVEG